MDKIEEIKEKAEVTGEMVGKALGEKEPTFTKAQLAKSQKYIHRQDALNALLNDEKAYSFTEVDAVLKKFNEGVKK